MPENVTATTPSPEDRAERGLEVLKQIGGASYDVGVKPLAEVSADMARLTVEFPYGEILARPGLDLHLRQVCTVATLLAQGSVQPQLKFHMNGLLNVGGTPDELVELLVVASLILGFPVAIDALPIVQGLFTEREIAFTPTAATSEDGTDRYRRGLDALRHAAGGEPGEILAQLASVVPELAQWTVEYAYGEVLSRPGLDAKVRHVAIIAMLTAAGNRAEALRFQIIAAERDGLSRNEIIEMMIQIALYAGFPSALNGFAAIRELIQNPPAKPTPIDTARPVPQSEGRTPRHQRGLDTLALTSAASGEAVLAGLSKLAPDIGRMILDHGYGDIFHRTAIDLKTRELTTCAAMAARATKASETPFRVHVNAALTAGATRAEIVEVLLNLLPHCGYPIVQQAMRMAGEEFARRGV
jgi:4-carboxymuconolactone decarboxylase